MTDFAEQFGLGYAVMPKKSGIPRIPFNLYIATFMEEKTTKHQILRVHDFQTR